MENGAFAMLGAPIGIGVGLAVGFPADSRLGQCACGAQERKSVEHELPVTHTTKRSGRPYTLRLAKTRALFERDAAEHSAWQSALDSFTRTEAARGKRAKSKAKQKRRRTPDLS